jgi:soluble lytic murein transglycosylase-like protein
MCTSYDRWFKYYGGLKAVDWRLLKAQVRQESVFDPLAVSHAGAKGLSQFMDPTWKWAKEMGWIPEDADVFDPEQNLKAQACYMRWLLNKWNEDVPKALASYNWGIGSLRKCIARNGEEGWLEYLPKETKTYLARIDKYYEEYKADGDE